MVPHGLARQQQLAGDGVVGLASGCDKVPVRLAGVVLLGVGTAFEERVCGGGGQANSHQSGSLAESADTGSEPNKVILARSTITARSDGSGILIELNDVDLAGASLPPERQE